MPSSHTVQASVRPERADKPVTLGANVDLGYYALTGILHVGRQIATLTLSYIGTCAIEAAYTSSRNGKFLGRKALQLMMSRTF